jgi:hypothetical protein
MSWDVQKCMAYLGKKGASEVLLKDLDKVLLSFAHIDHGRFPCIKSMARV